MGSRIKRYSPLPTEGLNQKQVEERIDNGLVNYDNQPATKSIPQIIRDNVFTYFNFLNFALGLAILVAGSFQGEMIEAIKNCLFLGVAICNTIISIIQEVISKRIIDRLSVLASNKATVIRDSKLVEVGIEEIVLDDILSLKLGNQVVTDAIVLEGEVEVNEAFLTGEVDPIVKKAGDMLLSGSFIVSGECIARVEHIGGENYISVISSEAKYKKKVNSMIMHSFEKLLKILSILIVPVGILFFFNQYSIMGSMTEATFSTVAAVIGMIPEGLVLLTSSVMAVSVIRLSKYKVLVQQLYCIEILARVNVICLDKTGTITEGKMDVVDVIPYKKQDKEELITYLKELGNSFGEDTPTMRAIIDFFGTEDKYAETGKIPFSSARKFSAVSYTEQGSFYIGAPEFVLGEDIQQVQDILEQYVGDYRVLVVARNFKPLTEHPENLKVLGFLLIQDRIRPDAKETLEYFKEQGVLLKIISGDNYQTVESIARRAGMDDVKGIDMTTVKDEDFDDIVTRYTVFGRVTPIQKKKLVQALKRKKYTVGMVGDGVNDVLALKESDCSIAMASGSEAARNVSELVLLDSNFASMPKIVAEGRRIINNIERSSSLLLSKTIFTILLIAICVFISSEYFFIPIQLTLITMFTIGIPSFILALEPNHELVEGNFLLKVLSRSLPAALTVAFNVIMVLLFQYVFHLSDEIISSLVIFLTAMTGFILLYRICQPFNRLRRILFVLLILGFVYGSIFQSDFFNIHGVTVEIALIFAVLLLSSLYVFNKLSLTVGSYLEKKGWLHTK